jgi:tetratricopeptide (TPR) repeat protein
VGSTISYVYEQNDQADDSARALQRGLEVVEDLLRQNSRVGDLSKQLAGFRKGGRLPLTSDRAPSDLPATLRTVQKAVLIWERLAREYPTVTGFQSDLASFYWRIGDYHWYRAENAQALPALQNACEIWEQLVRQNRNEPEYRANLAECLDHVGKVSWELGRGVDLDTTYWRSVVIREKLVAELPDYPDYRAGLAIVDPENWTAG